MEKSYSQVPILDKRKIDVGKYFSLGLVLVSIILNFAKTMIKNDEDRWVYNLITNITVSIGLFCLSIITLMFEKTFSSIIFFLLLIVLGNITFQNLYKKKLVSSVLPKSFEYFENASNLIFIVLIIPAILKCFSVIQNTPGSKKIAPLKILIVIFSLIYAILIGINITQIINFLTEG